MNLLRRVWISTDGQRHVQSKSGSNNTNTARNWISLILVLTKLINLRNISLDNPNCWENEDMWYKWPAVAAQYRAMPQYSTFIFRAYQRQWKGRQTIRWKFTKLDHSPVAKNTGYSL